MTKAYRKEDFDKLMAKVVKVDHRVKDYLEDAGYEKWSRVHSTTNRGRMMTSNIVECINGCLIDALLKHKNVTNWHPYCSDYYKPYALEKMYEVVMVPMPDKEDWNVPEYVLDEIIQPPRYRRLAGRRRKQRKKNGNEKITVNNNSCGQCGQEVHNRRTCTFFPKENWNNVLK
ncbi:uncharacterized protein [Solanum lycopersicum]|uniref:uncharacterized protein n=1 Tax=Solanum lycopersicum TaxID=4081 RepID=UPI003748EA14